LKGKDKFIDELLKSTQFINHAIVRGGVDIRNQSSSLQSSPNTRITDLLSIPLEGAMYEKLI